ncbi:DUF4369 domain-containing protein [Psychroflexus sp. ALD_RP9]|uniref:DUF4369 domain-containing protein n=1 Tax=Psychroflexus sp. ALD_RP9 TaxID=2777186 RepID=UPI001A8D1782|nr:DUF4369 domain-containing protein [Psychroflexus sp. ALD_RP9]QSS97523.1 DUF4369 domain-containing protein [Psychroflexus sp. ALD_RP9]
MKKITITLMACIGILSCTNQENQLHVNGKIEGLKKGTLYLQSFQDSSFNNLDSIILKGSGEFDLNGQISEPQILALKLNDKSKDEDFKRLYFFGDPNEAYTVNTTLDGFIVNQKILTNSKNQQKLEEFNAIFKKFNDANLDLIAKSFEEKNSKTLDIKKQDSLQKSYNNLLKRKYLYTVNFAINNKDLEVAPYVMLAEAYDANIAYLDTVYKSLKPKIQKSLYGQQLKDLIDNIKKAD